MEEVLGEAEQVYSGPTFEDLTLDDTLDGRVAPFTGSHVQRAHCSRLLRRTDGSTPCVFV